MSKDATTVSIGDLLIFPFQGEDWQSRFMIGLGLLLASLFVPFIPGLFAYGYLLQIMQEAIAGEDPHLPAWRDWGKLAVDGAKALIVGLVYLFPGIAIFSVGIGAYCGLIFALQAGIDSTGPSAAEGDFFIPVFFVAIFVLFLSIFLGAVVSLLGAIPLPLAESNLAKESSLGAAFRIRYLLRLLSANPRGYLVAWIVVSGIVAIQYVALMIAYYTIVLACFVPILALPLSYYALLIGAVLFGQAYRASVEVLNGRELSQS